MFVTLSCQTCPYRSISQPCTSIEFEGLGQNTINFVIKRNELLREIFFIRYIEPSWVSGLYLEFYWMNTSWVSGLHLEFQSINRSWVSGLHLELYSTNTSWVFCLHVKFYWINTSWVFGLNIEFYSINRLRESGLHLELNSINESCYIIAFLYYWVFFILLTWFCELFVFCSITKQCMFYTYFVMLQNYDDF